MRRLSAALAALLLLAALTGCDKSGVYSNGEGESIFAPDPPKSSSLQSSTSSAPSSSITPDASSVPEESPPPVTDIGDERVTVYGTPVETLSEFNYDQLYEQQKQQLESGSMKELGELLDSLEKPEVKDLYIRACAVTSGFANDGYFLDNGTHIRVNGGEGKGYYDETGFTYASFLHTLYGIFTTQTTQDILKNTPCMYEYDGALWQGGITPPCYELHTEYQLVENSDDSVEFNTVNYCVNDIEGYDPAKKNSYEKKTLRSRINKTADGWRIESFPMFGIFSSRTGEETEYVIDPDFLQVPDGVTWIPVYTHSEAFANYDALVNPQPAPSGDPAYTQTAETIIQTLINRNILAFDIVHWRGWETAGEPIDGTSVVPISSKYFGSLDELNALFYGTYTKEVADELLTVNGTPFFTERDGKLCADTQFALAWNTMPFTYKTYAELTTASADKIVFKWHYVMVFAPDDEEPIAAREMTFTVEKENGEWRLTSPVFDNPELDMSGS